MKLYLLSEWPKQTAYMLNCSPQSFPCIYLNLVFRFPVAQLMVAQLLADVCADSSRWRIVHVFQICLCIKC